MVLTWTKADLFSPSSEINTGLKFWGTPFWRMTLVFTFPDGFFELKSKNTGAG
jgi:hypothetical protein